MPPDFTCASSIVCRYFSCILNYCLIFYCIICQRQTSLVDIQVAMDTVKVNN
jgi:hypothetical protein